MRARGWLSRVVDDRVQNGLVTIIGSGATTLQALKALPSKDIFLDAPLDRLHESDEYNGVWCPTASASLKAFGYNILFSGRAEPLRKMKEAVDEAHSRGM